MQRDRRRIYPIMVIGHRIPDPAMSLTKSAIRHFDPQRQVYVLGDAKPDRKTPLPKLPLPEYLHTPPRN